jgi:ATP-binding cassette subfamily B protein
MLVLTALDYDFLIKHNRYSGLDGTNPHTKWKIMVEKKALKAKEPQDSTLGVLGFYKFMLKYQRHYPLLMILLTLCIIMRVAYEIVFPLISEWLFNTVLYSKDFDLFLFAMGVLGFAFLCSLTGNILQGILTPKITFRVITILRLKLFGKLQNFSNISEEEASQFTGHFVNDLNNIANASQFYMWSGITNLAIATIGAIFLFIFDWKMALVVLVLYPLALFLPHFFAKKNRQLFFEKSDAERKLLVRVQENIKMQDILRLFLLKASERQAFREDLQPAAKIGESFGASFELIFRCASLGILLIQFAVIFAGGYFVLKGQITPGRLVGFYFLLANVSNAINTLMNVYPNLINSVGSFTKIINFLQVKTFSNRPPATVAPKFSDKITFKNIQYSNDGDHLILNKINLELPKGKFIALVGASGSGKSTLLKLILKEITPTKGAIYLDGVNYDDIILSSLLTQIGVVMQEPKLFVTTIAENIRMGKLNATRDEIIQAAKKAGLHEDIMQFHDGYETKLGVGSVQLSGGQAQRLTIARALVANPDILCLDEVTSALDPISEAVIEDLLKNLLQDHTIIAITHRLKSVMKADLIIVIERGAVVEKGQHEELLQHEGAYARLWEKQQGFIFNITTREARVIPQWLTQVPLFSSLQEPILSELAKEFVMERASDDQIVFKENDHGEKLYILVAGIVEIFTHWDGGEKILAKLTDGDFFGEVALLFDTPRNASVRAKGACVFLTLHYQKFQKIFQKLPKEQQNALIKIAKNRLTPQQKQKLNFNT